MNNVNTPNPLAKHITAIRTKRASLMQDWHHAKKCALEQANKAKPRDRKRITRLLSNYWFDEPEVMAINDCIDLTWKIEAELKETQKVLAVCPPPTPIESATVDELWTRYCIERDAADPLTPGHATARAFKNCLTGQQPAPITITLTPNSESTYQWEPAVAAQRSTELCESLCRAVSSASIARPMELDLPLYVTALRQLIETARQDALCAVAGVLRLSGAALEDVGFKIYATGRFALLKVDDVLQHCDVAAVELTTQNAVEAEVSRWLIAGTGVVPNLFGMALDALICLCVLSRDLCRFDNRDAMLHAVALAAQIHAVHETLRGAAIRVALTDPAHSDFSQWLRQHATTTKPQGV